MRRNEARATDEDKIALVLAAIQLEQNQVCTCGAEPQRRRCAPDLLLKK
jgi:hypothetical protein